MDNPNKNTQTFRKKIENYSFIISDVIGKGYSSQVYQGKNDSSQSPVAIKAINMKMLKNQFNKQLLQSQIQILKLLKEYENILNFNEVYTTKNNTYIITQLCKSDLHKEIKSSKKLKENKALQYICQILQGYRHIFELGIIHRDLKPANILINQVGLLKIADFGFAIKIEKLKNPCSYNVGSPLYMSPEALKNSQYSFKSDVWAIGIILFEMLTGYTPWYAKYEKELLKKIQSQQIQDVLLQYNFSQITKSFLIKCLKKNVEERISPSEILQYRQIFRNQKNLLENEDLLKIHHQTKNQEKKYLIKKNYSPDYNFLNKKKDDQILPNDKNDSPKNIQIKKYCISNRKMDEQTTQARSTSNSDQKSQNLLKTVRSNPDKISLRIEGNMTSKNQQKRNYDQRFSFKNDSSINNVTEIRQAQIKKDQNVNDYKNYKNNTMRVISEEQQKKIKNKMLLSQIHLCRFMFKVMNRLQRSVQKAILRYNQEFVEQLLTKFSKIINKRLNMIRNLEQNNFLKTQNLQNYIKSTAFKNIQKLVNDYQSKYSKDLNQYWPKDDELKIEQKNKILNEELQCCDKVIRNILFNLKQEIGFEALFKEKYVEDIIILDYLMTCKQLLLLANKDDYQRFVRKSRIEQIVEGSSCGISYELYTKICKKAQSILQ